MYGVTFRAYIFNRPIRDDPAKSLSIKTRYTPRAVVQLVNLFNCLPYYWTVKA